MNNLDNSEEIKKIDKSSVLESISLLPDQIKQAWEEVFGLSLPIDHFRQARNIIVAGMGGSALGGFIIDSLDFEVLKIPLEIIKGYHLPAYANNNSLVIISSYSGNTEEALSCFEEARKKNCQIFAISTGGQLEDLTKKHQLPAYIFNPRQNPSNQPRLGLGYSITAQLAFLSRCGLISLQENQINESIDFLKSLKNKLILATPISENLAKKTATAMENKAITLVSAEHLIGVAHAFKNMLNENSKTFAVRFSIPELNHHLLEGLAKPEKNKEVLKFLFFESDIYDDKIKKRFAITKNIVAKNGIAHLTLELKGKTRLNQVFEMLYLGGFVSAYLAFLYGFDPAPIPWVDYFKKSLKKQLTAHEKKR